MAENPTDPSGNITYNYTIDQVRIRYLLMEKPPEMTDHEWSIISDEGFRKYMASQLGIVYMPRQDMKAMTKQR
jgi:hypothetical protein